jgi:hypothetical protein
MSETTTARKRPAPPTAKQLTSELKDYERCLLEAQHANGAARGALGGHIAGGDAEATATCRRQISSTAARIEELTEAIESSREAIQLANERERNAAAAEDYVTIKRLVADARREADAAADAVVAFARAQKKARISLDTVDAELIRCGVALNPYELKAKIVPILELALHVETDGVFGVGRTLENAHQLRQNGRASLKRAAQDYETLTLARVRSALHLMREPE